MAFHTRSNSFPSRAHPIVQQVDEHLSRLRSSEATSTSSSSINHNLSNLIDLYGCVDRLLQLPLTQQALAQEQNEKWTNELLDGSLRLLDVCSTAKDMILQTKAYIQHLQSIIRRTRGGESGALTSEVNKCLSSRKMVKKAIQKAMKNLNGSKRKSTFSSPSNDNETVSIISKLKDVEAITLAVFESLLSFIYGPKSKLGSWSLVSKMIPTKKVVCEDETKAHEFAQVDAALHMTSKPENVQNQLENLIFDAFDFSTNRRAFISHHQLFGSSGTLSSAWDYLGIADVQSGEDEEELRGTESARGRPVSEREFE